MALHTEVGLDILAHVPPLELILLQNLCQEAAALVTRPLLWRRTLVDLACARALYALHRREGSPGVDRVIVNGPWRHVTEWTVRCETFHDTRAQLRYWVPLRRLLTRNVAFTFTGSVQKTDSNAMLRVVRLALALSSLRCTLQCRWITGADCSMQEIAMSAQFVGHLAPLLLGGDTDPPAFEGSARDATLPFVQQALCDMQIRRPASEMGYSLALASMFGIPLPPAPAPVRRAGRSLFAQAPGLEPCLIEDGWFVAFAGNVRWALPGWRVRAEIEPGMCFSDWSRDPGALEFIPLQKHSPILCRPESRARPRAEKTSLPVDERGFALNKHALQSRQTDPGNAHNDTVATQRAVAGSSNVRVLRAP